jgi:hypothetical protein
MKYFKCGKCGQAYKIDPTLLKTSQVVIECSHCKAKNILRVGYSLVTVHNGKIQQFMLKFGENKIGRNINNSNADIKLSDEYVSRDHGSIYLEEKEGKVYVTIQDKKSTNGTFNAKKEKLKSDLRYAFLPDAYFIIGLTRLSIKIN